MSSIVFIQNQFFLVLIINIFCQLSYFDAYKVIWDNDMEIDLNEIDSEWTTSDEVGLSTWLLIYPGTKWCGAGDIATNDSDLGTQKETDNCCRTHDKCPDIIDGNQTRYGLENPSFYTRLNCACDKIFYKCLKAVNTKTSRQIGHIYFTGLGTQCYKKEYPIAGCNKYTTFLRKKCMEYIYNKGLPKKYQWFDVPDF